MGESSERVGRWVKASEWDFCCFDALFSETKQLCLMRVGEGGEVISDWAAG